MYEEQKNCWRWNESETFKRNVIDFLSFVYTLPGALQEKKRWSNNDDDNDTPHEEIDENNLKLQFLWSDNVLIAETLLVTKGDSGGDVLAAKLLGFWNRPDS